MLVYYTDSAQKSLWVLTIEKTTFYEGTEHQDRILTCFAAKNNSGFHIGQQVHNPKLENSKWQPLEGEILVEENLTGGLK